jgi:two-component sensor histidine kinase
MTDLSFPSVRVPQSSQRRTIARDAGGHELQAARAELNAALAREAELLRLKAELLQREALLAREFEHRLVNGLQLIVSILSMQSRTAPTPEAAEQLNLASARVAAIGRVHRRLHLLDHEKTVELRRYLEQLCDDLTGLLFQDGAGRAIVVTGAELSLPTALAIPLGFIVNELITNAVKYASGGVTVHIEQSGRSLCLSVIDGGPGLPDGFDPAGSTGLGMKIVQSLIAQIGGTLQFGVGDIGCGSRFTVTFTPPQ